MVAEIKITKPVLCLALCKAPPNQSVIHRSINKIADLTSSPPSSSISPTVPRECGMHLFVCFGTVLAGHPLRTTPPGGSPGCRVFLRCQLDVVVTYKIRPKTGLY
ncbi:hypothetical protein L484_012699 [Morus notabilis]|uniref:Uncharacterized protein n=1 Tax=Morus notabilis TaxID=981085 RepID=W9S1F4_9ROSA|nr:hypothetical protein L484_012699 [Morus notabilis]